MTQRDARRRELDQLNKVAQHYHLRVCLVCDGVGRLCKQCHQPAYLGHVHKILALSVDTEACPNCLGSGLIKEDS